jgi:hypothetical protein
MLASGVLAASDLSSLAVSLTPSPAPSPPGLAPSAPGGVAGASPALEPHPKRTIASSVTRADVHPRVGGLHRRYSRLRDRCDQFFTETA